MTTYNERYSRTVPVQLGDLEKMYLALAAADDYLMWLTHVQAVTLPGAGNGVRMLVKKTRDEALVLYQGFANDASEKHA